MLTFVTAQLWDGKPIIDQIWLVTDVNEVLVKDIACSIGDTHLLLEMSNKVSHCPDLTDKAKLCDEISSLSDRTQEVIKTCMKYAIQVIGLGTPISAALRKELEQEADLILNCQTVAANCETLLSTAGKSKDEVCLPNIPKKELVIQESKEQASPKSGGVTCNPFTYQNITISWW